MYIFININNSLVVYLMRFGCLENSHSVENNAFYLENTGQESGVREADFHPFIVRDQRMIPNLTIQELCKSLILFPLSLNYVVRHFRVRNMGLVAT